MSDHPIFAAPRVLLGNVACSRKNPGAIVIDPINGVVHGLRLRVKVYPQSMDLLVILLLNMGRFIPYEDVRDHLWSHDPDGGPLYAREVLSRHVHLLRKALEGEAIGISVWWSFGIMIGPAAAATPPRPSTWPQRQGAAL